MVSDRKYGSLLLAFYAVVVAFAGCVLGIAVLLHAYPMRGPQGETGPAGESIVGEKGDAGARGKTGKAGEDGKRGATGNNGHFWSK